eukprot:7376038-Prymnesium_polylepis.1
MPHVARRAGAIGRIQRRSAVRGPRWRAVALSFSRRLCAALDTSTLTASLAAASIAAASLAAAAHHAIADREDVDAAAERIARVHLGAVGREPQPGEADGTLDVIERAVAETAAERRRKPVHAAAILLAHEDVARTVDCHTIRPVHATKRRGSGVVGQQQGDRADPVGNDGAIELG